MNEIKILDFAHFATLGTDTGCEGCEKRHTLHIECIIMPSHCLLRVCILYSLHVRTRMCKTCNDAFAKAVVRCNDVTLCQRHKISKSMEFIPGCIQGFSLGVGWELRGSPQSAKNC